MPTTPVGDNLTHSAVTNIVARVEAVAESVGGRVDADDDAVVVRTDAPAIFTNSVVFRRPLTEAAVPDLVERMDDVLGDIPAMITSAWPTPDLTQHGLHLFGHPPFMHRPPGGSAPEPPEGLEVVEAADPDTLAEVERTLNEGFPVGLSHPPPATMLGPPLLGGPFRHWVGRVDGQPVATAAAMVSQGVVSVENVATLEQHRGHGYGEALTWAATMADPTRPAVLISSDLGRPVYERMGFGALSRWTLWGWAID